MIINSIDAILKGEVVLYDTKKNEVVDLSEFVESVQSALTPALID